MQSKIDTQRQYRRIGGICAITWVTLQIIGDALHPRLPVDSVDMMHCISTSPVWMVAHLILLFDYLVLIPMTVSFAMSFGEGHWANTLTTPLVVIAVTLGIVQVCIHPTVLTIISDNYMQSTGGDHMAHQGASKDFLLIVFKAFWIYNIVMEFIHLLILNTVIFLFAIQMRGSVIFKKWLATLGIIGSMVAIVTLVIGEVVLKRSKMGDLLIFGVGMLPLALWLVVTGINLLRYRGELPVTETKSGTHA